VSSQVEPKSQLRQLLLPVGSCRCAALRAAAPPQPPGNLRHGGGSIRAVPMCVVGTGDAVVTARLEPPPCRTYVRSARAAKITA
jgi:hypothetical protein